MRNTTRSVSGLSRAALLAVAGGLWLAVGIGLAGFGGYLLTRFGSSATLPWVPVAIGVGWVKSRAVLCPLAGRNVRRILEGPSRRPLPAAFAPRAWLLVAGFMALGAALRRSAMPRDWLGLVYVGVGVALALASRVALAASRNAPGVGDPAGP